MATVIRGEKYEWYAPTTLQFQFLTFKMTAYCYYQTVIMAREEYRQVSNIRRTLVGNWIVDHSDVVGASPVGAAPTTSSFST